VTGTDFARFKHKSVPVIFEPPCISATEDFIMYYLWPKHVVCIYNLKLNRSVLTGGCSIPSSKISQQSV